jgi:hypothetical protein
VAALAKESPSPSLLRLDTLFDPQQVRYDAFDVRLVAGLYLRPLDDNHTLAVGQVRSFEVLAYDARGNKFDGYDGLVLGAHALTRDKVTFRIETRHVDPKLKYVDCVSFSSVSRFFPLFFSSLPFFPRPSHAQGPRPH